MAEPVAKAIVALEPDTSGLKDKITAAGPQLGSTFKKLGGLGGDLMAGEFGSAWDRAMDLLPKGMEGKLGLGMAGVAAGVGAGLYKLGSDFHTTYAQIEKQTGATGKNLEGLEGSFRNVAKTSGASFDKIGSAVGGVSQATGATGKDLETLSSSMLRMSSVTGKDLNTVIDGSTKAFKNWGIGVADMPAGLDKLYVVSTKTGVGVDQLASGLQTMGPTMRQLGFSFDQSAALLGSFEKAGLNTNVMTGAMTKALGNLAAKGEKDVPGAFMKTVSAIKSAKDPADAMSAAVDLFGKKAGPQLAEAIQGGALSVDDLTAAVQGSSGALKKTADDTATFGQKFDKFKNQMKVALEPVATGLFDAIQAAMMYLTPVLTTFANILGSVVKFITGNKVAMAAFAVVLGAIGAAMVAAAAATLAMSIATKAYTLYQNLAAVASKLWAAAQWLVNAAMEGNPIGLLIIAVVALIAVVVLVVTHWKQVVAVFKEVWGVIVKAAGAIWDAIKGAFNFVISIAEKVWEFLKKWGPLVAAVILSAIMGPLPLIILAVVKFHKQITDALGKIVDWFKELPGKLLAALGNLGAQLLKWVQDAWHAVEGGIEDAWAAVKTWFTNLPGNIVKGLGDLGAKLYDWLKAGWVWLATKEVELTSDFLSWVGSIPGKVVDALGDLGSDLLGWVEDGFDWVVTNAGNVAGDLVQWFTGLPTKLLGALGDLGTGLLSWVTGAFKTLSGGLATAGKDVVAFFKNLPGELLGVLGNLGKSLVPDLSGLEKMPQQVGQMISSVVSTISELPAKLLGALSGLGSSIGSQLTSALSGVSKIFTNLGSTVTGGLKTALSGVGSAISGALSGIGSAVTSAISGADKWLVGVGHDIITGLANGIKNVWSWVTTAMGGARNAVVNGIKGAGQWLLDAGHNVVSGLQHGISNVWGWITGAVQGAKSAVLNGIKGAIGWLYGAGRDIVQGAINGVRGLVGSIQGAVHGVYDKAKAAMVGALKWLESSGRAIIQGLIDGITHMLGNVKNAVMGVVNAAKKLLPFSPAKEGPFSGRGAPIYHGMAIASGIAEGISAAAPLVAQATAQLASAAQAELTGLTATGALELDVNPADLAGAGGGANYNLTMNVAEANTAQLQGGFRRLELLSGAA